MLYIEMARDPTHGGGSWSFTKCVWAPTEKQGGGRWPFWEKVRAVKAGDTILHLKGIPPNAEFVGFSTASSDGFITESRPPDPAAWSFSSQFYRADLQEFTPFHRAINLSEVFAARREQLEVYFDRNRNEGAARKNIFFVRQGGRLQCLNGAYLSEADGDLFQALFDEDLVSTVNERSAPVSVETGIQLSIVKARIGQARFANEIKKLYGFRCCFPGCEIDDERFLIGSHIARWSDNELLRGNLGNGLCLCISHDRAFELGLFTLDESLSVFVNPREVERASFMARSLSESHGVKIHTAEILPLEDALLEHWNRVDLLPLTSRHE